MWKSHAEWPKSETYTGPNVTEDQHWTRKQAEGVCHLLRINGFVGDAELFPIRLWVTDPNGEIVYEWKKRDASLESA